MLVDFINLEALTIQTKSLKNNLTREELEVIMNDFNKSHDYIPLTLKGFKDCAKKLSQVSNKQIKLNHALEIFSRTFYNLPWHTVRPRLENEEFKQLKIEIENIASFVKEPSFGKIVVFYPDIPNAVKENLSSLHGNVKIISTVTEIDQVLNSFVRELEIRQQNLNETYPTWTLFCERFHTLMLGDLTFESGKFLDPNLENIRKLLRTGRNVGLTVVVATSKCISYNHSDRVPETYKIPTVMNFTNKNIFKVSKS